MSLSFKGILTEQRLLLLRYPVLRYGLAAIAPLVALGVRLALDPVLSASSPYLPFVLGIIIAARAGGRGPGCFATLLSTLAAAWFFVEPRHSFAVTDPNGGAGLALFVVAGLLISVLVGNLQAALAATVRTGEALGDQTRLVDLSHDAIITTDADRRITGWNQGAQEMYGWREAEVLGKAIHALLQTSDYVPMAAMDAVVSGEGRWEGELTHVARDGRRLCVESRQVLLRSEQGHPRSILEINRDITDRNRAQEELREALAEAEEGRRLLDALMESVPLGITIADAPDVNIRRVSRFGQELIERPPDEITGIPADEHPSKWDIYHPDGVTRATAGELPLTRATRHGEIVREEEWIVCRKDGSKIPILCTAAPIRDKEGGISGGVIGWQDVTNLKRAEQALRQSERRYSALFANKINGIAHCKVVTDADGSPIDYDIIEVNDAYETITGIKKTDIEGKRARDVFPGIENFSFDYIGEYGKVALHGGELSFEAFFETLDQWLSFYVYSPQRGEFVAIFTDISQRKQADQALRDSEAQFRTLANAIPQLCWMANPDGWIFWYNQRWYEYTGTLPEQMEGWGWQSVHDPARLPQVMERWKASIETGERFSMIFPLRGADGVLRPFLTRVEPVRDSGGRITRWFGTNTDISEQQKNEEAVRESEQRYRALFESMQEGFIVGEVICGPAGNPVDWRYLQVNDAMASLLRLRHQDIIGHTYRELFPDAEWEYWVRGFGQVALTGEPARLQHYGSGTGRHYQAISYSPAPGQFAAVFTDVSERKMAEERLRQAQKLESVGLLAGGVAHDFNNLLTVIMGSASAALDECPTCEHSKNIVSAAERAAFLTKQLLAYAGKGQFVKKAVDITEVVSRSKPLLGASVPKRVELVFNLTSDLPPVEEDPSRVEQILMNFVINAGEAIPPKTDGRIEVGTGMSEITPERARRQPRYDVEPGNYVWLEVRDNGAGMDEATLSRIFDPFFSTKFTGRGLGLAAVDGIVRSSKGFIEVHSFQSEGTTFRVFLPASGGQGAADVAAPVERQRRRTASTVLVVDDEEMVRKLATVILRRHGYEVLEATDGKHARQVLAGCSSLPSVVLLDLAMPVMGGDELVPVLERQYPDLKVIISSGYPEEEARKCSYSPSVAGFLQKPYSSVTLINKIDEILGSGPQQSGRVVQFPKSG